MAVDLPTSASITGVATTKAQQKLNLAGLRDFMANLFGTDSSDKGAARAAMGAAAAADIGKNKLINGNFGINQRVVSGAVTLAAGIYGHDRWKAGAAGCSYTFATTANVTTITISAGSLQQVVEGLNLQSGSHVLSWAGTAQGRINGGAYGASGAVTATAVGGTNMTFEFGTGTVSLAQLETGTLASAFEQRLVSIELVLCQRYCFSLPASSVYGVMMQAISSTTAQGYLAMPVTMSATPTLTNPALGGATIYSATGSALGSLSTLIVVAGNKNSCMLQATVTSGLVAGNAALLYATPTAGPTLFTAEL